MIKQFERSVLHHQVFIKSSSSLQVFKSSSSVDLSTDLGNLEGLLQIALLFEGAVEEIVDQTSFEKAIRNERHRQTKRKTETKRGQTKHPAINTMRTLFNSGPHLARDLRRLILFGDDLRRVRLNPRHPIVFRVFCQETQRKRRRNEEERRRRRSKRAGDSKDRRAQRRDQGPSASILLLLCKRCCGRRDFRARCDWC